MRDTNYTVMALYRRRSGTFVAATHSTEMLGYSWITSTVDTAERRVASVEFNGDSVDGKDSHSAALMELRIDCRRKRGE